MTMATAVRVFEISKLSRPPIVIEFRQQPLAMTNGTIQSIDPTQIPNAFNKYFIELGDE